MQLQVSAGRGSYPAACLFSFVIVVFCEFSMLFFNLLPDTFFHHLQTPDCHCGFPPARLPAPSGVNHGFWIQSSLSSSGQQASLQVVRVGSR
jgi:hypothetical protein